MCGRAGYSVAVSDGFSLSHGGLEVRVGAPLDGSIVVELRGDLDSLSVPALREALDRLYAADTYRMRIDLKDLVFIDSSGLGALVGAWRTCHSHDGKLEALDPKPTVRTLMDMTGISRFLLADGATPAP